MILTKVIKLNWVGNIKDIYEKKGYKYTGNRTQFEVNIEDLELNSGAIVICRCDNLECNEIFERRYCDISDKDKHYCKKCSHKFGKKNKKKYDDLNKMKNDLLNLINNKYNGRLPKRTGELFGTKNNIASWDIYKDRYNINSVEQLLNLFKFKIHPDDVIRLRKNNIYYTISKEEVIKRILDMQSKSNKPLMYDDFRNPKEGEVGITLVKKYFGTMNKMKEELGLEIIQENMILKHISDFEIIKDDIVRCCHKVFELYGRKLIQYSDITSLNSLDLDANTINKYCKQNNTTMRKIIEFNGYQLQTEGNGLVYSYDDGEKVKSSYELLFSNKLREYGYRYNEDYYRDIRYKTFIPNYNGLLDCDYKIYIRHKIIYIELAGMLRDYENKYKVPEVIPSKSKKKYAEKLNQKENMFVKENLNYFILFPSDLKEDNLDFLFENKLNIHKKLN